MVKKMDYAKGVEKYLKATGREILNENFNGFVVFKDEDELVFARTEFLEGCPDGSGVGKIGRKEFEKTMYDFLSETDTGESDQFPIRFDVIQLYHIGNGRAIVKHCVNAGTEGE